MVPISEIEVGKRIRKVTEDIDDFAENIREFGLLEPIIVMWQADSKYLLLAGQRRLEAVTRLGHTSIEAKVMSPMDAYQMLMVEVSENEQRQQFTHMERLQYGSLLDTVERENALLRKSHYAREGRNQGRDARPYPEESVENQDRDARPYPEESVENQDMDARPYPEDATSDSMTHKESERGWVKGTSRDIVGPKLGYASGRQYDRAKTVAKLRPDLLEKVDRGEIKLYPAYQMAVNPNAGVAPQSPIAPDAKHTGIDPIASASHEQLMRNPLYATLIEKQQEYTETIAQLRARLNDHDGQP
jgi:hypothetical protein